MTIRVSTPKSFLKYVKRLKNLALEEATIEAVAKFQTTPKSPGLNFEPVTSRAGFFTIRVDRKVRVLLFEIERDAEYEAKAVGNHDLIYDSFFRQ